MAHTPTFDEILNMDIHGCVHLHPSSEWAGRQTAAAEARAKRWATTLCGVTHFGHMVCKDAPDAGHSGQLLARGQPGWRFMTGEEAELYLEVPRDEYESLLRSIPPEWSQILARGRDTSLHLGQVIGTRGGASIAHITRPSDGAIPARAERLEWHGPTARLMPTGDHFSIQAGDPLIHHTLRVRHHELPVQCEEDIERLEADPMSPAAIDLREALHLRVEACAPRGQAHGEDTQCLGYARRGTVRMARLMALGCATVGRLDQLAAAQVWEVIRTLDAREARCHYYPWIQRLPPHVQQLVVARWVRETQVEWLPGGARDAYLRRLHSGYPIGPEKRKDGWEVCARCRKMHGLAHCTAAHHETICHACIDCPAPGGAAEVMKVLTDCWERVTGEKLRPVRATAMFGDRRLGRSDEEAQEHRRLEEPWRAAHAAVVLALDSARRATRPPGPAGAPLDEHRQPQPWGASRVVAAARNEMQKIARKVARLRQSQHMYAQFRAVWVASGVLELTRSGGVRVALFDRWDDPARHPPTAKEVVAIATDGSGTKDGRAGWGIHARRLQPGELASAAESLPTGQEPLLEACGPVITSAARAGHVGASRGTNNTGELNAIHEALTEGEKLITDPGGQELHILADSFLAIHTTTGAWKPRSNKRMVDANKAVLARLRKRGLVVRIRHVRAHRGHAMNERADALAKMGALGCSMRRAACPHSPTSPTPTPTPSPTPHQPLPAPTGASVNRESATVPD